MAGNLHDLTHDDLDALAEANLADLEGYPRSGTKADKVDALKAAGIAEPPERSDGDKPEAAGPVRLAPGGLSPTLAATRDAERARAAEQAERRTADLEVRSRPADVSDRSRRLAEATAEREAAGAGDLADIIERLGDQQRTGDNVEE